MKITLESLAVSAKAVNLEKLMDETTNLFGKGKPSKDKIAELVKKLEQVPFNKLVQFMSSGHAAAFYPSEWARSGHPYPEILAKALVKSSANASLSDWLWSFYDKDRKLSPEAGQIFIADILVKKGMPELFLRADEDEDGRGFHGLMQAAKKQPDTVKKILMKLPKDTYNQLIDNPKFSQVVNQLKIVRK